MFVESEIAKGSNFRESTGAPSTPGDERRHRKSSKNAKGSKGSSGSSSRDKEKEDALDAIFQVVAYYEEGRAEMLYVAHILIRFFFFLVRFVVH